MDKKEKIEKISEEVKEEAVETTNLNIDEKTQEKVNQILKKAKEKGKLTYGELASELDDVNPNQLEKIYDAMEKMGVDLSGDDYDDEPDEEDLA